MSGQYQPNRTGSDADANPRPPRWRDIDWQEVAWHAGTTAEQDQRHKALFFDEFVPPMVAHVEALRTALGYCLDSLKVVGTEFFMAKGATRAEAEKLNWADWSHPANSIRAARAVLALDLPADGEPQSSDGSPQGDQDQTADDATGAEGDRRDEP